MRYDDQGYGKFRKMVDFADLNLELSLKKKKKKKKLKENTRIPVIELSLELIAVDETISECSS